VIYAGLMTFSIVVTNITSLLPRLASGLYEGRWSTALAVVGWLFSFFLGGFLAGFCVEQEKLRGWRYFHLLPLFVVIFLFIDTGLSSTEALEAYHTLFPGLMLFSLGVLNAMVGLRISSILKASQITGVVNQLGVDVSKMLHTRGEARKVIRRGAFLRLITMLSFITGAVLSVALFPLLHLHIFFIPATIISIVILHDLVRF
jgi:uncharacterized membrane protein YoaK (UPF0700 family)